MNLRERLGALEEAQRQTYCKMMSRRQLIEIIENLFGDRILGAGAARVAIQIAPSMVLKVAYGRYGRMQGYYEMQTWNKILGLGPEIKKWVTGIYYYANDGAFIISEKARPMTEAKFEQIFGVPLYHKDGFVSFVDVREYEEDLYEWIFERSSSPRGGEARMVYEKVIRNNNLKELINLFHELPGISNDLITTENWGLIGERPVILDFGLIDEIA